MYFNPYETKAAKKKRIISNICIAFIIVSMALGILAICLRGLETVAEPFYIQSITVDNANISETEDEVNSFAVLQQYASTTKSLNLDQMFAKDFPTAYALLKMDQAVYSADKNYCEVADNKVAFAQCFISENTDWRELEVMLASVEETKNENLTSVCLQEFNRFTLKYNARNGALIYAPYNQNTFRLTIQSLNVTTQCDAIDSVDYELVFDGEYDQNTIRKYNNLQIVYNLDSAVTDTPAYSSDNGDTKLAGSIRKEAMASNANTITLQATVDREYMDKADRFTVVFQTEKPCNYSITIH